MAGAGGGWFKNTHIYGHVLLELVVLAVAVYRHSGGLLLLPGGAWDLLVG